MDKRGNLSLSKNNKTIFNRNNKKQNISIKIIMVSFKNVIIKNIMVERMLNNKSQQRKYINVMFLTNEKNKFS